MYLFKKGTDYGFAVAAERMYTSTELSAERITDGYGLQIRRRSGTDVRITDIIKAKAGKFPGFRFY